MGNSVCCTKYQKALKRPVVPSNPTKRYGNGQNFADWRERCDESLLKRPTSVLRPSLSLQHSGVVIPTVLGLTWEALDLRTSRRVQVHHLKIEDEFRKKLTNRVSSHLDKYMQLQHEYLAELFSYEVSGNDMQLYIEYTGNYTLSTHIRNFGKVGLQLGKKYARMILLALQQLHSHGLVHGDLRTSTVFLSDRGGECKVNGFFHLPLGNQRRLLHKWSAPEVLRGQPATRETDIWGFGSTMLQLFIGTKSPLSPEHSRGVISELPTEVNEFLVPCFETDPWRRPNVYDLLTHPFLTS